MRVDIGKKLYSDIKTTTNNPKIIISDIDIPFWTIVKLMIKISVAAIPAAIILFLIYGILAISLFS